MTFYAFRMIRQDRNDLKDLSVQKTKEYRNTALGLNI